MSINKNESLSWRDYVWERENRIEERPKYKALPEDKQRVFDYLNGLSGKEYTEALNEWRSERP